MSRTSITVVESAPKLRFPGGKSPTIHIGDGVHEPALSAQPMAVGLTFSYCLFEHQDEYIREFSPLMHLSRRIGS